MKRKDENTVHTHAPGGNSLSSMPIIQSLGRRIEPEDSQGSSGIASRREIVDEMAVVLNSCERRNIILLGKAGTGKTTLLRQLATRIEEGTAGKKLEGAVLVELDISLMKSEGCIAGGIEKKIRHMWAEAENFGNVVFFMDEGHKTMSGGSDSIGNILKPLVTSGRVPVILATTDDEYVSIERDAAMKRRFSPVHVPEPDRDSLLQILARKGAVYAKDSDVAIGLGVCEKTLELAKRYIHDSADPDRSLRVLEKACSIASLEGGKRQVTAQHLLRAVAMITNASALSEEEECGREQILKALEKTVKGQESALKKTADFLVRVNTGFHFKGRPKGVLLLTGPAGCGKTLLAESAGAMLGFKPDETVRINLSQLGCMPVQQLLGYGDFPGILTSPLRKNPCRLVLLEDVDKADRDVYPVLHRMLDEGILRDALDRTADFRQSVVVMTASLENAGLESRSSIGFASPTTENGDEMEEHLLHCAQKILPKTLIDRIGGFIALDPLREEHLAEIFRSKFEPLLREMAKERGYLAEFSPEVVRLLASEGANRGGGAREFEKLVVERLMTPLAGHIAGAPSGKTKLVIEVHDGSVVICSLACPPQELEERGAA